MKLAPSGPEEGGIAVPLAAALQFTFGLRQALHVLRARRGRPSNRFYANLVLTEQRFQRGHRPASDLNLQAS